MEELLKGLKTQEGWPITKDFFFFLKPSQGAQTKIFSKIKKTLFYPIKKILFSWIFYTKDG